MCSFNSKDECEDWVSIGHLVTICLDLRRLRQTDCVRKGWVCSSNLGRAFTAICDQSFCTMCICQKSMGNLCYKVLDGFPKTKAQAEFLRLVLEPHTFPEFHMTTALSDLQPWHFAMLCPGRLICGHLASSSHFWHVLDC